MTERNNNPKPKEKKAMKEAVESMKNINKSADVKMPEAKPEEKPAETAAEEKKEEAEKEKAPAKTEAKKPKKKDEAVVNSHNLPISTKTAADVCRYIKGNTIEQAQEFLEQVMVGKKALPMKGEIPHRKGKRMMSGGFPKEASKHFIVLLKSLSGNANVNGIDDPVIVFAMANMASRPFGRFGRVQKKRTHVKLIAREKKILEQKKKKGGKNKKLK